MSVEITNSVRAGQAPPRRRKKSEGGRVSLFARVCWWLVFRWLLPLPVVTVLDLAVVVTLVALVVAPSLRSPPLKLTVNSAFEARGRAGVAPLSALNV